MDLIRVSILGEHAIYVEALAALLEEAPGLTICSVVSDLGAEVHCVCEAGSHVVLIDVHHPLQRTLNAIGHILNENPQVRILALIGNQGGDGLAAIVRAGASGYVPKSTSVPDLVYAIKRVAGGGAVIDPGIAAQVLSDYRRLIHQSDEGEERSFSHRELHILRMLADGASNKEIADELILSQQTVKNILSDLYRRLHADNRTEAVTHAMRNGLISAAAE